jgi:membrane fusion protein, multidrug efflux system
MADTTQFLIRHGLPLVFAAVFLEQMGLPLPAAPWLMAAGALSATGEFNLLSGLAVTVIACLAADAFWFYLGRHRGARVLGLLCRISLEPDSCVRRTQNLFTRYGLRGVLVAKFVPGLGTVAPPLAGMAGVSAGRFLWVDGIGSLLYGGCCFFLGYFFSSQIQQIGEALTGIGGSALALIAASVALYLGFKFWQRHRVLRELRMARITADELRRRQEAGEQVLVLDLRSRAAVEQDPALIPGALVFSLDDLETRHHELPRDRELIVYCSCPNEVSSARMALLLQRKGFTRVRPLLGGIDAWREQNYPMEPRPPGDAAALGTAPPGGEGVVAKAASFPAASGNASHPAKGGDAAATILVAAAALLGVAGCKPKAHLTPPPPLVEVAPVTQADVPIYHEWIGVLDGLVNAQIRAQVPGYLITQDYREGDPIKKGDLLFQIDPRPFKAVLDQAKGLLAQAEARSGKTELDVKRYGPLVKDRAISQEEYEDAVQANLEAKAAVVSAKAQVEQAQLNFEFTSITSPINGIASIAKAQIGDLVGPATGELTTVSTIDPIKAYYRVTEQAYINFTKLFSTETDRIERLKQLEIELLLTDGTVYPLKGRIYAAGRQIGSTTGALRVEALFPNPGGALRPGQFARVRVTFDLKRDALLVPQRAVSELQGSYQVAVVDAGNKVHLQPVRVGEKSGRMWIIEEGLHRDQRVVVEGTQNAREGVAVMTTNFVAAPIMQSAAAEPTR